MTTEKPDMELQRMMMQETVQKGLDFIAAGPGEMKFRYAHKLVAEADNDIAEALINAMDEDGMHTEATLAEALQKVFSRLKEVGHTMTETMEGDEKVVTIKRVLN
jgi:hypothetical protein